MDFEELQDIQRKLKDDDFDNTSSSKLTFIENNKQLFDLFDLKRNDLLTCLPPKVTV